VALLLPGSSRTLAQLCTDLQGLPVQELEAWLKALAPHHPNVIRLLRIALYGHPRREWDYLVREGRAFGWWFFQAAVAGQFSYAQLIAQAKRVLVFGLITTQIGSVVTLHNAAIAGGAADPVAPGNLLGGGGAGASTTNLGSQAAAIPGTRIARIPFANFASPPSPGLLAEIPAGRNVIVSPSAANAAIEGVLWFAEVDDVGYP
jgi:hypothetical protein